MPSPYNKRRLNSVRSIYVKYVGTIISYNMCVFLFSPISYLKSTTTYNCVSRVLVQDHRLPQCRVAAIYIYILCHNVKTYELRNAQFGRENIEIPIRTCTVVRTYRHYDVHHIHRSVPQDLPNWVLIIKNKYIWSKCISYSIVRSE